ncbi:hypothetical protein [Burkholderia ubonensis]|uniref:Uncharacterized protein n=1 Tax=Burkholderia ubonensis TaxID=101571 RepID=A0A1R1J240_9BURK|nr:hypothetical protein [Burkholderia ubonensis]OMG69375.1 hypothetical protein BW685_30800 [Burkholderia ubonensis]
MDMLSDLIRRERFYYADCIALGHARVIGYTVAGSRLHLNAATRIDESDLTDIVETFSIEIAGATYAGGEGVAHGSCGFFYKRTGDRLNWAVMSTESDPFFAARRVDGGIAFLSRGGDEWVVPGDDVASLRIDRRDAGRFQGDASLARRVK